MISNDDVKKQLKSDWAHTVLPTDVKRVIIPLREGVEGRQVDYVEWDGSAAQGEGFLFYNATDDRGQFLKAHDGILIGHEGVCPQGEGGKLISRSEAVANYMRQHPEALSSEENIQATISYLQEHVFRHDAEDPTLWDETAKPDIWCSDKKWLKKNFNERDIMAADGSWLSVISAAKKTEAVSDAVYFGPNVGVEGVGATGDRGSWVIRQPDGVVNLCTEEVFNRTYRPAEPLAKAYYDPYLRDMVYPKGSMRHMPESGTDGGTVVTLEQRLERNRARAENMETPVFRVLGRAILDYIENGVDNVIRHELEFNGLLAHDRNELSLTAHNPKSDLLKGLLAEGIIDDNGRIVDAQRFVCSDVVKNYKGKGIDLSHMPTMKKLAASGGKGKDISR